METANIEKLRYLLEKELKKYKGEDHIKLNVDHQLLEEIIFKEKNDDCKVLAMDFELIKKLDLTGVSFDKVRIDGLDFTNSKGVVINPQTVYEKRLTHTTLDKGVTVKGSFYKARVLGFNVNGAQGVVINPQHVYNKVLLEGSYKGAKFEGDFRGVDIRNCNFEGSSNAIINPRDVARLDCVGVNFKDTTIVGNFDDVIINNTKFGGSVGASINPQTIRYESGKKEFEHCDFKDVTFTKPFATFNFKDCSFRGSHNAIVDPQKLFNNNFRFENLDFGDITFVETESGMFSNYIIMNCNFEGSKNTRINFNTVRECIYNDLTDVTIMGGLDKCTKFPNNYDRVILHKDACDEQLAQNEIAKIKKLK